MSQRLLAEYSHLKGEQSLRRRGSKIEFVWEKEKEK